MLNKPLLLSCGNNSLEGLLKTADFWFEYDSFSFTKYSGRFDTYYDVTFGDVRNRSASCSVKDYATLRIYSPSTFDVFYAPSCILFSENIAVGDKYFGVCAFGDVLRGTTYSEKTHSTIDSLNGCRSYDSHIPLGFWFEAVVEPLGEFQILEVPCFMAFWKDGIPNWVSTYYTNLDSYGTESPGPEIS